jgi:hypothetical protein
MGQGFEASSTKAVQSAVDKANKSKPAQPANNETGEDETLPK